jgi:hypothetical protein
MTTGGVTTTGGVLGCTGGVALGGVEQALSTTIAVARSTLLEVKNIMG